MSFREVTVTVLMAASLFTACKDDAKQPIANVTWHQDIKPLLDSSCIDCHAEGKLAFPLETIDQAVRHKDSVLSAVTQRRMPIWLAAPGHRLYNDDPTLSDDDIAKLSLWYENGSPEGTPQQTPIDNAGSLPLTAWNPDIEIAPLPHDKVYVPSIGRPDDYRCFMAEWPSEDPVRYITGFHVIPGNERIVHHLVAFKVSRSVVPMLNKLMAEETRPGYQCFGGSYPDRLADENVRIRMEKEFPGALAQLKTADMWLFHWAPGMSETLLPDGIGIPVRNDDVILLQVHYYPGNSPGESDSGTTVQFKTASFVDKPAFVYAMSRDEWFSGRASNSMVIAPGEEKTFTTSETLAEIVRYGRQQLGITKAATAVEIHSANLHMHSYGTASTTGLTHPDGRREVLLDIPVWDVHWQRDFIFKNMINIPAQAMEGTVQDLSCRYVNPSQKPIYGGLGSDDEMCISMSIYALVLDK
jgi:hypothetical protein